MRIIGGQFKGRRFYPPAKNWPTRPTTDFSKEGLFNILQNRLDFAAVKMLDLFGGTGNHTYEAISRGCTDVTYVDKHGPCIKFVKDVCEKLDIEAYVRIKRMDVAQFIASSTGPYDYIFAGPPYPLPWLDEIPDRIFAKELLAPEGLFVLEHNDHHDFQQHPHFEDVRSYGGTLFSFFSRSVATTDQ